MKRAIPTLLLLFGTISLCAQEIRLSAGFNTLNPGNVGNSYRIDGGAGVQLGADALFGDRLFVQPGLGYVLRNLELTTVANETASLVTSSYTHHGLRLSVLGGYRFLEEIDRTDFNIKAFAGPMAIFGLGSRFDNAEIGDISEQGAHWFMTLGAGLERDIFFLEGAYDLALSDAFGTVGAEGRLNMLRVNAGVRLRLLGRTATTPATLE